MGRGLSLKWARVQDVYFKWLGMKCTCRCWVVALIKKLWGLHGISGKVVTRYFIIIQCQQTYVVMSLWIN